jgi:multiple sugar transport system permease protein
MKMRKFKNMLYNPKYAAAIMGAPGILLLIAFVVVPFILAFIFSLTNRSLIPNPVTGVVYGGLKNYLELIKDPLFYKSLFNNVIFTLVAVPIQVFLALMLALLINQRIAGVSFFRTIFFSPVVLPMIIVSITWSLLFTPDSNGFINTLLHTISFGHIEPLKWLFSKNTAMMAIIILSVWQGVGFQMVIFLSGLQSVALELYEAASIDGAGSFKKFINITLPQLRNCSIFVLLSSTIMSFKLFTQVLVLTKGGPQESTNTIVYMIYQSGYASAVSVVFFVIVFTLSLVQQRLTKMTSY